MLATRMAPKPPSPPAAAFEGNDACACRSSNEARPRMTNIPLLRTVLTRSPSEGRVILRRASGSSEPGHAIRAVSLDSTRTFDRDAFDRLLPPKPINGEHPRLVCSRLVFRGSRLVPARQGWDPSIAFALALEGSTERLGAARCSKAGEPCVSRRAASLRRTGLFPAGRSRHPRVKLDRASDISVASLASMRRATRGDMPARAAKIASAAQHREVRSASTTRDAFPR